MQSYPSPSAGAGDGGQQQNYYPSASNPQQPGLQNADDLQMSAQISRLTPIMNAGPDGRDPRTQEDLSHQYAQAAQAQRIHSPIDQLGAQYGSPGGPLTQKQRSKSSRACDECRRKKIKCTPPEGNATNICSNCARSHSDCRFSRAPLKRGPSKGYIKELADRVHTLENQIHPSPGPNLPPFFSQSASPAQGRASDDRRASEDFSLNNAPKRRRISPTPGGESQVVGRNLLQSQQPSWAPQQESRHVTTHLSSAFTSPQLPVSTPVVRETNYSPNNVPTLSYSLPNIDLQHVSETLMQESNSSEIAFSHQVYTLDASILDGYCLTIQPTYPLLAEDRTKLHFRLSTVPADLRDALCECVHAAVRSFPINNHSPLVPAASRKGARYILHSGVDASRPLAENIVYLQCMLLLAIEAGNRLVAYPAQTSPNQPGWLSIAVGLALRMKIPLRQPRVEADVDSDDHMLRRIWWNLVVMDRCIATTMSTQYLITDKAIALYQQDKSIIGQGLWNMSQLAITLGHYSLLNTTPEVPLSVPLGPGYAIGIGYELDRCKDSFLSNFFPNSHDSEPVYSMLYWHIKILISIESELAPSELLTIVRHAQANMTKTPELTSPLKYQCFMVILLALIDLRGYDKTKDEADGLFKSFLDARIVTLWDALIDGWIDKHYKSQALATAVDGEYSSLDSQRLQRLADLATASGEGREVTNADRETELDSTSIAPTPHPNYVFIKDVLRKGSLSLLSEMAI